MNKGVNVAEQNFVCVEFQNFPLDYHTWGCPIFVLEAPLQGVPSGLPKWEPMDRTKVYLGHSSFHKDSVSLLLNTRIGYIYPQYHVVFDDTFSTMDHMKKGTIPGNWKNMVEDHSQLATQ